jgi:hypothetical protein
MTADFLRDLRSPRLRTQLLIDPCSAPALTANRIRIAEHPGSSDERAAQAYRVQIPPDPTPQAPITIAAPTTHAVRHALAHVLELARGPHPLPSEVRAEPRFAKRGVLLDVSRKRVPTMRHLVEVLDELALLRFNHLQLYIEHTFAYAGHEDAWLGHGAITPDELRRLDALARERGIELAANQNCFGHLRHWLELPRYRDLAETHGDWMFDIWPRSGPFSLCPTDPRSLALVSDWIAQQAPCVRSDLFNINCDEVYDIAFGRSKADVERRGRVGVFCEFVAKVCEQVRAHGKRPMFWGDVVLTHDATPEHHAQLESLRQHDPIALVWGYEPDTPFDAWLGRVRSAGLEAWVCPGTSCWRSIAGRATERRENVANAIAAGIKHGVRGILLCEWGDSGHWQTWPVTRHALRSVSPLLWDASVVPSEHQPVAEFAGGGGDDREVGAWIDALADADIELRSVAGALSKPGLTRLRNQTALFASLARDHAAIASVGHADLWHLARDRVHALAASLPDDPALTSLERDELAHTANLATFAADRAVALLDHDDRALAQLPARIASLERDHRRLWLARSRPGGLDQSCSHFAAISTKRVRQGASHTTDTRSRQ